MAAVHPKNDSDIWLTVESGTLISQLLMVGWIVGRTHRGHHGAMLWSFFVALIVLVDLPRVLPAAIEAVQTSKGAFTRFFGIGLADFIFLRLPILGGGIWCVRQKISQQ
jgi:hypothetical protein